MKSKDNIINLTMVWEVIHNEFPSFKISIENILENKKK